MTEPKTEMGTGNAKATSGRARRGSALRYLLVFAPWALVSCGILGDGVSDKPTIDQSQAEARIDQLIAQATGELDPEPELERFGDLDLLRRCVDPSDGGSEDRVVLSKRFWLRGIPKTKPNASIAEQVMANLEKNGHKVYASSGLGTAKPEIFAASQPDDFRLSLTWNASGALSIGATSPCIWQTGTPGLKPTLD